MTFPATRACPYEPPAEYARWREDGLRRETLPDGGKVWVVSRHADVRAALTEPRLSADGTNPAFPAANLGLRTFARMDDPEHARLRRTLTGSFTVKRMNLLRPRIEEVVRRCLDELAGPPVDLVRAFALPIPTQVISLLLGVPYADHEFFHAHSAVVVSAETTTDAKRTAAIALFGYLRELVAGMDHEDDEGHVAGQQAARVRAGELTLDEAVQNCVLLLIAGHESTSHMLAMSTLALLEHPAQIAKLHADPAAAVEELMRYLSISESAVRRVAVEDVVIGGQLVRAGEGVVMCLPAANRDPAFTERPEELDLGRIARGHLGFGYGVHQCLGQSLARLELAIALPALFRRVPGLRLAVPIEEVRFRHSVNVGLHALPVEW